MVHTHRERETKFDVDAAFRLPNLTDLAGEDGWVEASIARLDSTYFDTADHALLTRRVTLRRREGDIDNGWHLKVPAGAARTEIQLPLQDGQDVPARLRELVVGLALGQSLRPVASVRTTRHLHLLYADDEVLAEIADDHVHATAFGADETNANAASVSEWREVEVELRRGDERLLAKVGGRLADAGASPSAASSKLARTLAHPDDEAATSEPSEARTLVGAYLFEQLLALSGGDVALRRGLEPVHKTRVAARRLRSCLRVFEDVLVADDARSLDAELSWYQDLLGEARDRQVQRARFADAVSRLPVEVVLGPVAARIEQTLLSEQVVAMQAVRSALDGERYRAMMTAVADWALRPRLVPGVDIDSLEALSAKARRKAAKRLKRALAADGDAVLLHRARKAAKRGRYATELTAPAASGSAKRLIKEYKHVQDVLGEHQDSTVAAALLLRLGAAAGAARENGFTYGLLYERELARAENARSKAAGLKLHY